MIFFNARILAAVAIAQSKDVQRPQICGVLFEGTRAIATDGFMLLAGNDSGAVITEAHRALPISKKIIAALRKPKATAFVHDGGVSQVLAENGEILCMEKAAPVAAAFPDYRSVVPGVPDKSTSAVCFAESVLTQLSTAARILGGAGREFRMSGASVASPHIVEFASTSDVFGVAMPCVRQGWRDGDQYAQLPEWWL